MDRTYYVYILTNVGHTVLYTGVTSNFVQRVWQHREKQLPGFSRRYRVTKLVYYEEYSEVWQAIEREKQIKAGSRQKKLDLVNGTNPEWEDLYPSLIES